MIPSIDPNICTFGANILHNYSQALFQEVQGVREGMDIEFIHRMRVASRRLRSAIPLFSDCLDDKLAKGWRKQIRKITLALGAARDADVQIDTLKKILAEVPDRKYQAGIARIILRLSQNRLQMQVAVNRALGKLLKSDVIGDFEKTIQELLKSFNSPLETSQPLFILAEKTISAQLQILLGFSTLINEPNATQALHAMRIEAKRLRYTMEIFAPIYPDALKKQIQIIRKTQEWLGNIHDCDVWLTSLPGFMEEERDRIIKFYGHPGPFNRLTPGFEYLQQNKTAFRQQQYTDFLQQWQDWSRKGIWDTLQSILKMPLLYTPNISPTTPVN